MPSPEKLSPNKSPPNSTAKGFNPNAPSFVPMALQPRPSNVRECECTCRSILVLHVLVVNDNTCHVLIMMPCCSLSLSF